MVNPNFGAAGSGYDSEENSGDYNSDDVSDKTVSFKEIASVYSDVEDPEDNESMAN